MRRNATLLIKHRDAIRGLVGRMRRLCSTAQRFTANDTKTELVAVGQETCLRWHPTLDVMCRGLAAVGNHGLSRCKSRCFQGHIPTFPPAYGKAGTISGQTSQRERANSAAKRGSSDALLPRLALLTSRAQMRLRPAAPGHCPKRRV